MMSMDDGNRLVTGVRRALVIGLIAVGAATSVTSVFAAPDPVPAWPNESELVTAMRAGLKDRTNKAEALAIRGMHEVMVGKTESAFLVSVWFPERGRNFSAGAFLYRPALKQARELDYSQSLGLRYVAGHYGEFSLLENYGSGQGTEDFIHALVRFKGWETQVLHKADFGNNLGTCGEFSPSARPCEQTHVQFQLLGNSASNIVEMIEVTTQLGGSPKEKLSVTSRRFRLDGNRFRPVKGP
jgi:hypothetical protein